MQRFHHYTGTGIGYRPDNSPSMNHYAGKLTKEAAAMVEEMGLQRVAGNVFECPSTKEFWKISDNGGIVRLTSGEVDNGEKISPAPKDEPADFLSGILAELEF